MKFGVAMFPTEYTISRPSLAKRPKTWDLSLCSFPEHTHIPASRLSPWPGGAELPREYSCTLDPFMALTAVATVTKNLKLGTGICLVTERDPIVMAKEVATLDYLSNGRVLFGIGAGWNREEMENHGANPDRRFKLMRERTEAMKAIWANDEAEYHGEFVNFDPIWQWPKPIQKPNPPVLIGGDSEFTLKRVVRYGDGWMPIGGRARQDFAGTVTRLNDMAAEAGRGPIPVSLFGAPAKPEFIEKQIGLVERILFTLPPGPTSEIMPLLESRAALIEQFA